MVKRQSLEFTNDIFEIYTILYNSVFLVPYSIDNALISKKLTVIANKILSILKSKPFQGKALNMPEI